VNTGLGCGNIWSLAINHLGHVFAGTAGCGAGVYRSTDDGTHWTLASEGLTTTDVGALAIAEGGQIFAGTYSQFGVGGGMFRSLDNGRTWTEQNNGFTALDVNAVVIGPSGDVFAAANGGVFRSGSNGKSWTDISGGLLPLGGAVTALAIDADTHVLAGTSGGGVFRSGKPTVPR
jgi:photosystem II stability/assembly factor-like uncharacterized protein